MRIALIADIHSNIHALEAVLKSIEGQGIRDIYCLGDTVGYGAFPNEVVAVLSERNIPTIQGNYDESVGEELFTCGCDFANAEAARLGEISNSWTIDNASETSKEWLRGLPKNLAVKLGELSVLLVHGSPRKNNEYLHRHLTDAQIEEATGAYKFDVLVCGHTHQPYHRVIKGRHYVNPGSVGKPKHGNPNALYGIVEVLNGKTTFTSVEVAYDNDAAAEAITNAGLPAPFAAALK